MDAFLSHVPPGTCWSSSPRVGEPLAEGQVLAGPARRASAGGPRRGLALHLAGRRHDRAEPRNRRHPAGQGRHRHRARAGRRCPGPVLADRGRAGIWREVLLPGSYRLNPYGYKVKAGGRWSSRAGLRRRQAAARLTASRVATSDEMGILKDAILQPGIYPLNTEEYEVIPCDVGIYQTTYHYVQPGRQHRHHVPRQGWQPIELDCTIEWELRPDWPAWVAKFGTAEGTAQQGGGRGSLTKIGEHQEHPARGDLPARALRAARAGFQLSNHRHSMWTRTVPIKEAAAICRTS